MENSDKRLAERLRLEPYPLSSKYDIRWVLENQMGPNVLWLTEALCRHMDIRPGMRLLDMGCGKAISSVFLAREFGAKVWANDLWIPAKDNWERIVQAGMENEVFPIHAEAHALPYAEGFFEAVASLDSYHYYGTDDLYLKYILSFLKPGGQIGIVVPALMREFGDRVPEHLTQAGPDGKPFWDSAECFSIRTLDWWRRHWTQTELVDVEVAETIPDGWREWLMWAEALDELGMGFPDEAPALREDRGEYLGFAVLVARRREVRS